MLHQYDSFPSFLRQFCFNLLQRIPMIDDIALLHIINENIFRTNSANPNK
jgi:hypothetical protein